MDATKNYKPDYLFEVSWEICNKVGGIYTVISTKALTLQKELGDNYLLIGPDVWKETRENPDFIEDRSIFRAWCEKTRTEGLNIRIGRWNIKGKPIVILIDFTPFFPQKDSIFYEFWEKYKVDSLSGQWDYIEPAMFGYAAAKVIESFYEFNLSAQDRIIAQFHEWMTGMGILYLNDRVPQVGTIFTTHATTLGRTISGNGLPLYEKINDYKPLKTAREFNIISKFSLERASARLADCFTTVSEITSKECAAFFDKNVDVITVNGFEDSFVPSGKDFEQKRTDARNTIKGVAQGLLNQEIPDDSHFVLSSGRYEFRNKGIDLYLDALGALNKSGSLKGNIVAVIAIPAHHSGIRKELLDRINNPDFNNPVSDVFLTHHLFDEKTDPILKRIKKNELMNKPSDKVKVIFVPAYLDGQDGIFNKSYYDLLIGFDLTVFPSYYEPWGYTPLESAAFKIPTITTNLAGFGLWVGSLNGKKDNGVFVIDRSNDDEKVSEEIASIIREFAGIDDEKADELRKNVHDISRKALWSNFISNYYNAYAVALEEAEQRSELFKGKMQKIQLFEYPYVKKDEPTWNRVFVELDFPEKLAGLQELAGNFWWSWNCEAIELFESIDPETWDNVNHNPVALLESLPYDRLIELERDDSFVSKLSEVYESFRSYMRQSSEKPDELIAYFSMEYGLHESLKLYSGGLGVLAGDYLKEASDSNKNLIGIGILFRQGYFQQQLSAAGEQIPVYDLQKFDQLPLSPVKDKDGKWIKISLALPGRNLSAKVWRADIGRIPLYLLDSDLEENHEKDRFITYQLYGGDIEYRLVQELLLGVGGIRLLDALDIRPDVYHCNEGHAAFIGIERLRYLVHLRKLSFEEALEVVRASSLFTTHTPVPAGHDSFSEDLLRTYIPHYAQRLNISWDRFMGLGKFSTDNVNEKFSMSILAINLSQEVNGVSNIHGHVSREMFKNLFHGYFEEELHIGHVTNGVHFPTWTAGSIRKMYDKVFGKGFINNQSNTEYWKKIRQVPAENIWNMRVEHKKKLVAFLKKRLTDEMTRRQEAPNLILNAVESLDEHNLIIGFARRFATYKRANLLFNNLERLSRIVNDPRHPVHIVYSGKAHPNDRAGQEQIKNIIEISRRPEFAGKVFFLENYDMYTAKIMVQGVDVWLNTPTRPLEASGTSGQKAVMNGVLNFSVLDGWWAEGYKPGAGWAIKETRTYQNQVFQDELDAETIYNMLDDEIIPHYYNMNSKGIPLEWIAMIKNSISDISPYFTMKRMLDDYFEKYYHKLAKRGKQMDKDNFKYARKIAEWKQHIRNNWDNIEIVSIGRPDYEKNPLKVGNKFSAEIHIKTGAISPSDLGLEVVFGQKVVDEPAKPLFIKRLKFDKQDNDISVYKCNFPIEHSGLLDFAFRLFPVNDALPHRQDFELVRWI